MESVIKWHTGEPKEEGCYLVTYQTLFGKNVEITEYDEYGWGNTSDYCKVIAWCPLRDIEPYKKETMDKANKSVFDANAQCCDIMNHLIKEETMEGIIKMNPLEISGARCIIPIPKGYEFAGVDDDKQQVVFERIGCQCPRTYEECCKVLFPHSVELGKVLTSGYNCELLKKFGELLICRDAYWKIASEQMGLGKPWEPNFKDGTMKYTIECHANIIIDCGNDMTQNVILAFPTKEMRDAFYENFKDLIEQCKELL